jgi:molecular chaperone IbpA
MRTYNLTPLFPYSVGFDRFDKLFETVGGRDVSYPPYNIVKAGDDQYRITMAVAGFSEDDLEIVSKENVLTVRGKVNEAKEQVTYLHRGIGTRAFEHTFQLADYVKVKGATLKDGLLDIELQREVPEEMKPRKIAITHESGQRTIESQPAKKQAAA